MRFLALYFLFSRRGEVALRSCHCWLMCLGEPMTLPVPPILDPEVILEYTGISRFKMIGFWASRKGDSSGFPWPGNHIDPSMPESERERVASILDSAPIWRRYLGHSWDRLNPEARVPGSADRAAAGWVFPEGLSFYVRKYGLVLPYEFLVDVQNWKPEDEARFRDEALKALRPSLATNRDF